MGLTKDYLRYIAAGSFNIIASQNCNIVFVTLEGQEGRFVAVGACEHIIIWDLRLAEKAQILPGEKAAVTCIFPSPKKCYLAAGYNDGSVKVYDLKSSEVVHMFYGHRSEVTALVYDSFGHKLASGSKDTDIIVWDTVAEVGLYRLSGHHDIVTQLQFMTEKPILISASKDTFVKFWDLNTQHCFKTLTGHQSEVWSLSLIKNDQYLVTGCGDAELRVWKLFERDLNSENEQPLINVTTLLETDDLDESTHELQCQKTGSILRRGRGRVMSMFSDATGQIIGCHGTDMEIELFQILSENEAKSRLKKRAKKLQKKGSSQEDGGTSEQKSAVLSLRDEVKRLPSIKLSTKPKSLNIVLGDGGELRIAVNLTNNTVELYTVNLSEKDSEPKCLRSLLSQGHHSEVRSVSFSSDNLAIVSGSGECVKLWNRSSQACLRTVNTGMTMSANHGSRLLVKIFHQEDSFAPTISQPNILDSGKEWALYQRKY